MIVLLLLQFASVRTLFTLISEYVTKFKKKNEIKACVDIMNRHFLFDKFRVNFFHLVQDRIIQN